MYWLQYALRHFWIAQTRKERESFRQLQTSDLLHHCASDSFAAAEAHHHMITCRRCKNKCQHCSVKCYQIHFMLYLSCSAQSLIENKFW